MSDGKYFGTTRRGTRCAAAALAHIHTHTHSHSLSLSLFLALCGCPGEIPELKLELLSQDKKTKLAAMKKVIANMTLGNDMSALFPEVLGLMQTNSLELKKMVYLYVITYAKLKPELALMCVNSFIRVRAPSLPYLPMYARLTRTHTQTHAHARTRRTSTRSSADWRFARWATSTSTRSPRP
jgi:hypothetical protein